MNRVANAPRLIKGIINNAKLLPMFILVIGFGGLWLYEILRNSEKDGGSTPKTGF